MLSELIRKRRAYRSLKPVRITNDMVEDMAENAGLSASCFNNQPWRYVFVYGKEKLAELKEALARGNAWAKKASLIIAVCSAKEMDCSIKGRDYYLFDTGMATAFILLRAVEMGLVAHPIAGFNEEGVKEILAVPAEMQVITLVIVGRHADEIDPDLSEQQAASEKERPERLRLEEYVFIDTCA